MRKHVQYIPDFQPRCWDPDDTLPPPPIISARLGPLLEECGIGVVVEGPDGSWGRIDLDALDDYVAWATTGRRHGRVVELWDEDLLARRHPTLKATKLRSTCSFVSARWSDGFILVTVEFYDPSGDTLDSIELNVDHLREQLRARRLLPQQQPWWRKAARWLDTGW